MAVVEKLNELLANLVIEHGEYAIGIVLGPKDYLDLCEEVACLRMFSDTSHLKVVEFLGLPVSNKSTDGIELLISLDLTLKILGQRILEKK